VREINLSRKASPMTMPTLRSLCAPAGLAALLALSACGSEPAADAPTQAASAPEAKPGLSLTGGRLVLPAVKGNPAAAYFRLANTADKPATIAAVDVAGAGMAMLHETVTKDGRASMGDLASPQVKPGETLAFAPGGKHVMVMDLPADWKAGGTAEMTLIFSDGDKLSAPLAIEAPGGN
jgi:hypothetical protein